MRPGPDPCSTPGPTFLVIDSAHGHSKNILEAIKQLKADFPDIS